MCINQEFTDKEKSAIAQAVLAQNRDVLRSTNQILVDDGGYITVNQGVDGSGWHLCRPIFRADRFPDGIHIRRLSVTEMDARPYAQER